MPSQFDVHTRIQALGVLNVSALRKQLAIVETRLTAIQAEKSALQVQRDACALLLNQAESTVSAAPPVIAPSPFAAVMGAAAAPTLLEAIRRLLATQAAGLSADEIYDELKARGFQLPKSRPVREVYTTLETNEIFLETAEGRWVLVAEAASPR